MQLTNEQKIKLAECAKYTIIHQTASYSSPVQLHKGYDYIDFNDWNPSENIAQAFECLGGFQIYKLEKDTIKNQFIEHTCIINYGLYKEYEGKGQTPQEAICKAILKALEGE